MIHLVSAVGLHQKYLLTSITEQLSIKPPVSGSTNDGPVAPWVRQLWTGSSEESFTARFQPKSILTVDSRSFHASRASIRTKSRGIISIPPALANVYLLPSLPATPRLHSSRLVHKLSTPSDGPKAALAPNILGIIPAPQFKLIVHPDYRPPPPTPFQTLLGANIYAPMDFCTLSIPLASRANLL